MRAAVYHGPGDVRIETRPEPNAPRDDELLLEVLRVGICGSDASEFVDGPHFIPLHHRHHASGHHGPVVLGHEFVGRILAVGPAAPDFSPGQRVATGAVVWCGTCPWCREGKLNLCERYHTVGLHRDGGLAEYALAPARTCRVVPDGVADDAAAMAQPLAVALHAVRRGSIRPGEPVALIGVGGIGAFAALAIVGQGLGPLIAVDVDAARLATATSLGAKHIVLAGRADATAAIRALTGEQGAHVVIEASGTASGLETALAAVRRGGRVVLVGLQSAPRPLDLFDLCLREVEISTALAHVGELDLPEALEILAGSPALPPILLDRVIGLDALVDDGLRALAERRTRGKILIDPRR